MLTPITPENLAQRIESGEARLIDVREPEEFSREHISGAVSLPLSRLDSGGVDIAPNAMVVFTCKSGMRTNANCTRLAQLVDGEAFVLDGGVDAWKRAGFEVATGAPPRGKSSFVPWLQPKT